MVEGSTGSGKSSAGFAGSSIFGLFSVVIVEFASFGVYVTTFVLGFCSFIFLLSIFLGFWGFTTFLTTVLGVSTGAGVGLSSRSFLALSSYFSFFNGTF